MGMKSHTWETSIEAPMLLSPEAENVDNSRVWVLDLVEVIASFMPGNVVATTIRLVNKAAAQQFDQLEHKHVQLSKPTPRHAFAWRWGNVHAVKQLTWDQRRKLMQLTVRSGSIDNLEVLTATEDYFPLQSDLMATAAGNGQMNMFEALLKMGCPWDDPAVLKAAARGGHRPMCIRLLAMGCPCNDVVMVNAARVGHAHIVDMLLPAAATNLSSANVLSVLREAARGYGFRDLGRFYRAWKEPGDLVKLRRRSRHQPLLVLSSPTPDWKDKANWLQRQGFRMAADEYMYKCEDWQERQTWLRSKGYQVGMPHWTFAARALNLDALSGLLPPVIEINITNRQEVIHSMRCAAIIGHLPVLELFFARGAPINLEVLQEALSGGQLRTAQWIWERLAVDPEHLTPYLFTAGAASGDLEVLQWMYDRGFQWDADTFVMAAEAGSEEQLEWLAARGCPMGVDGQAYALAAGRGDLPILRCLRRLGCPWSKDGKTFNICADATCWNRSDFSMRVHPFPPGLVWLLEEGCPVDWEKLAAGCKRLRDDLVWRLKEVQKRVEWQQKWQERMAALGAGLGWCYYLLCWIGWLAHSIYRDIMSLNVYR